MPRCCDIDPSKVLLHLALLFVQSGTAGYQIITRVALTEGMSVFTFAVYRGAVGLCILIPAAFFLERKKRPPLTWPLVGHFFVLGLTGVFLCQAFFLEGLSHTSPTFAAAIQNSIPAITFIIAAIVGQERVNIRRPDGQAKLFGTILCVAGATLMVFYKGPAIINITEESLPIDIRATNTPALSKERQLLTLMIGEKVQSWQLGAFYLMGMCIAFSIWLIIQSPVIKQYPARLSVTAFSSLFGTLQLLFLAVCKERDPSKWLLPWGPALLSVLYAGLVVSGLVFSIQMWCVQKGGAVLVAVYQPAQTIIVAILTLMFLRENFYLGSLVGGLLLIGGLYVVTWGQGEEKRLATALPTSTISGMIPGRKSTSSVTQLFLDGKKIDGISEPLLEDHNASNNPRDPGNAS